MNLNKNKKVNFLHKIYILIGLFAFSVFIVFYVIARPAINDIAKLNKDIVEQKIELEKKINREKNKTSLIENIKKIEPEIDSLDEIYLDSNKELEFITSLEGIANQHNVTQALDLVFQKEKKSAAYITIPLNITIEGKYFDTLQYIKSLESLNSYININNLEITLKDEAANIKNQNTRQQMARFIIEAETFWK